MDIHTSKILKYDIEIGVAYYDKSWDVKKFSKIPARSFQEASQFAIKKSYQLFDCIHCWLYSENVSE